ncbi:MAG: hypothetical protein ACYDH3_09390 [Candidatus Aminicenantales bacterium]
MNEFEKEIQSLKEELGRKRDEISDLKKLAGRDIDREFTAPLEEFSDKEMDDYLRDGLSAVNALADARPDLRAITSPRKALGRPIAFLKRKLLETTFIQLDVFLDRQIGFNKQVVALVRIMRGRMADRMKALEEKTAGLEEDTALLRGRLDDLGARMK